MTEAMKDGGGPFSGFVEMDEILFQKPWKHAGTRTAKGTGKPWGWRASTNNLWKFESGQTACPKQKTWIVFKKIGQALSWFATKGMFIAVAPKVGIRTWYVLGLAEHDNFFSVVFLDFFHKLFEPLIASGSIIAFFQDKLSNQEILVP